MTDGHSYFVWVVAVEAHRTVGAGAHFVLAATSPTTVADILIAVAACFPLVKARTRAVATVQTPAIVQTVDRTTNF